jgi:hypothetical protein
MKTPPKRGRPRKDVDDQIVVDAALAAQLLYGLGPQQARDFALALLEGRRVAPSNLPRGAWKAPAGSVLASYELIPKVRGREATVARKLNRGAIKPRPDVVLALVAALRANEPGDRDRALKLLLSASRTKKPGVARKPHF